MRERNTGGNIVTAYAATSLAIQSKTSSGLCKHDRPYNDLGSFFLGMWQLA